MDFSIYNYKDNEKTTDTFTVIASNVPDKYYNLTTKDEAASISGRTITNTNTFTIENVEQYQINTLMIKCIDEKTKEEINKQIWLGGSW